MERLTEHFNGTVYPVDFHMDNQIILNKLANYEDMEEQGNLLKLPCKIGDIVYRIWTVGGKHTIAQFKVTGYRFMNGKWQVEVVGKQSKRFWDFDLIGDSREYGNNYVVYTTYERAKGVLECMKIDERLKKETYESSK